MAGHRRLRPLGRFLLAAVFVALGLGGPVSAPDAAAAGLSRWSGRIDLFRVGVFTTQKTWLWCTAADVQIIANIVDRAADHSTAGQQRYFDYMRDHNRYAIPVTEGVDPVGWTAGLRRYVDKRYRLTVSRSFDAALRSAVTNLRRTNLPVGITVARGSHAWVLTGFSATADPATTTRFTVTSVRVVGPLWGRQSRSFGYDMRPNTNLTPKQLAGFFTPWHYAGVKMSWEGRWVSVQPIEAAPTTTLPAVKPPGATRTPTTAPSAPTPTPTPTPIEVARGAEPAASAGPSTSDVDTVNAADSQPDSNMMVVVGGLVAIGLAVAGMARLGRQRR